MIRRGIFNEKDFVAGSKSLVCCFQTLEHLPNPGKFCAPISKILKPGGAVYFVMHDRKATSARILGKKSPIYDIEHLQIFCRESATALLMNNGFERVRIKKLVNTYPIHYWCKLFPFPHWLKSLLVSLFRTRLLRKMKLSIPAGNLAVIGFRKE